MSHIAEAQKSFLADGYELRRVGPVEWAYIDIEAESEADRTAAKGATPAEATRALLRARYGIPA